MELLKIVREKLSVWTAIAGKFPPENVNTGPVMENGDSVKDVNISKCIPAVTSIRGARFVRSGRKGLYRRGRRQVPWKKNDLILLPIKPGGVEHQHFKEVPDQPTEWPVFSSNPMREAIAHNMEQKEEHPADWTKAK